MTTSESLTPVKFESLPYELVLHILTLSLNSTARSLDTTSRPLTSLLYSSDILRSFSAVNRNYNALTRSILFKSIELRTARSAERIFGVLNLESNRELRNEVKVIGFLVLLTEAGNRYDVWIDLLELCQNVEEVKFESSRRTEVQSTSEWPVMMNFVRSEAMPLKTLELIGFLLPIHLAHFETITTLTMTNIAMVDGWRLSESFPSVTTLNYSLSGGTIDEESRNFLLNMAPQLYTLRLDGSRITFSSLPILLVQEILSVSSSLTSLHLSHLDRYPRPPRANQPPPLEILNSSIPLEELHLSFDQKQFIIRSSSSSVLTKLEAEAKIYIETFDSYTKEVRNSLSSIRAVNALTLPLWLGKMGKSLGCLKEAEVNLRNGGIKKVHYENPNSFIKGMAWINLSELR